MAFDFDAAVVAPFRMQPGLRRLAPGARQLTPSEPGGRHLQAKLAVLRAHADQALLGIAGFDARAALDALAAHAAHEQAPAFGWDGRTASARRLGWAVQGAGVLPLDDAPAEPEVGACLQALPEAWRLAGLIALAFEEDFAIVDGRAATIPWLAVALPSHWSPQDKVGRHFAQVHAPVADNQLLLAAADALSRLVCGPDRWERFVWTVTPLASLDAHPARAPKPFWPDGDAAAVLAAAWWRTERQTFLPLPRLQQAVFTIGVDVQPLARAVADPARARRLHDAIASMSPAVLAYRGLAPVRDRLLAGLAEAATV